MKYPIEQVADSQTAIQYLEDRIYVHNTTQINTHDGALFSFVVRDENKNIIAGIGGWTWANICEITQLWVDESVQRNGIGKRLLDAAEAEARSKDCRAILVRSYSFQAPHFYEKHGYNIVLQLKDFPTGHYYYFLTKSLG